MDNIPCACGGKFKIIPSVDLGIGRSMPMNAVCYECDTLLRTPSGDPFKDIYDVIDSVSIHNKRLRNKMDCAAHGSKQP